MLIEMGAYRGPLLLGYIAPGGSTTHGYQCQRGEVERVSQAGSCLTVRDRVIRLHHSVTQHLYHKHMAARGHGFVLDFSENRTYRAAAPTTDTFLDLIFY